LSDVEQYLASVEAALQDADANLSTDIGGHREQTSARLWRGQVLVDWEPDQRAGDCLLRPSLLRRLIALHARVDARPNGLILTASGRLVSDLTAEHADVVKRLGGSRRVELEVRLRITQGVYRGGDETYFLVERGRRMPLLRLEGHVRLRPAAQPESPRTSRAPK
jgi:hypothetical protein